MGKGAWAVSQALDVGVFPYLLKLLEAPSAELREVLSFIWVKIVTVDGSVTADLMGEGSAAGGGGAGGGGGGWKYFVDPLLAPPTAPSHAQGQGEAREG